MSITRFCVPRPFRDFLTMDDECHKIERKIFEKEASVYRKILHSLENRQEETPQFFSQKKEKIEKKILQIKFDAQTLACINKSIKTQRVALKALSTLVFTYCFSQLSFSALSILSCLLSPMVSPAGALFGYAYLPLAHTIEVIYREKMMSPLIWGVAGAKNEDVNKMLSTYSWGLISAIGRNMACTFALAEVIGAILDFFPGRANGILDNTVDDLCRHIYQVEKIEPWYVSQGLWHFKQQYLAPWETKRPPNVRINFLFDL